MKKAVFQFILLGSVLVISYNATAQVKVGVNPTQIVTGAKLQVDGDNTTATPAKLIVTGTGNTGIGTAAPGTTLDVNGAITNRETAVAVTANAATIAAGTSQVRLTGSATATIAITAAAAPNSGQRLVVYNNTSGSQLAVLNNFYIPAGQAVEFSYSNGAWIAQQTSYLQIFRIRLSSVTTTASSNGNFTNIPLDATSLSNPNIWYNTIAGSTVNANNISLPLGTYRISASAFLTFNSAPVTGTQKYGTLEVDFAGTTYSTLGWLDPSANVFGAFINGTCIVKVTSANQTVGLKVYTAGVDAVNTMTAAAGGITNSVLEIERIGN